MAIRITRSATRSRASALLTPAAAFDEPASKSPATLPRRKRSTVVPGSPSVKGRNDKSSGSNPVFASLPVVEDNYDPVMIPAVLSFSFDDAKKHLIKADSRFDRIFAELPCRPFEHLEPVDPFQTLVVSILGQQISWLAARSIKHKFLRLFDPSLPEKVPVSGEDSLKYKFPSPGRLAGVDAAILKSAGLSTRKAEYILDVAARFADGRLSTEKLAKATDQELDELLIAVRGIGKWTVDMFAMFSLRRPDILAVGDLGLQRGLLQWVLSSHEPDKYPLRLIPKKLPKSNEDENIEVVKTGETQAATKAAEPSSSVLPAPVPTTPRKSKASFLPPVDNTVAATPVIVSVPLDTPRTPPPKASTSGKKKAKPENEDNTRVVSLVATTPVPLPEGLTLETLKSRANGKKAKGGAYLLPAEMHALTQIWGPYRSLACYYLWAIEGDGK
ncbi:DNA glycosylase [Ceratobasidium sp. AG-I]|nr:DNA glycosylase [Ceratobasidium sp. AG-I]